MHRVVCCYPDYDALVGAAAERAQRYLVMSFPRPRCAVRAWFGAANVVARLLRWEYRTWVHPAGGARRRCGAPRPRPDARDERPHLAGGRARAQVTGCYLARLARARRYDRSMAVSAQPKLDAQRVRADFPIFEHPIHGKPLAYLDSAASSQKPRQVLDAMTTFYETSYANIHRGVYDLAERSTEAYEAARETVRAFVNAGSAREIVFTRNVTAAINTSPTAGGSTTSGQATSCSPPSSSTTRTSSRGSTSPGGPARSSPSSRSTPRASSQLDDARRARWSAGSPRCSPAPQSTTRWARSCRCRGSSSGRTPTARSWSWTPPRRPRTRRSTSRRSAPTSSASRPTSSAGRPGSALSGAGPSCSRPCRRSSSAAT